MSQQTLDSRGVAAVVITDLASSGRHSKGFAHSSPLGITSTEEDSRPDDRDSTLKSEFEVASQLERVQTLQEQINNEKNPQNERKSQFIFVTLPAGSAAGALAKTTIAPLDRTKIYFQATQQRYAWKRAANFLKESYRKDGLLSLWRGNSATMTRIIPYAGIQFTAHEHWKKVLKIDNRPSGQTPTWLRFVAGALTGVTAQTLTYPLDMARARMAVTPRDTYSSFREVFVKIWKQEGPLALYRGLTPTVMGVAPYAGASFGTYETLKHYHRVKTNDETPNPFERMLFGAIAGAIGQSSSYPLEIVRRRMQTAMVTGNGNSYKTVTGTILKVYRDEGIVRGLYKGLSLNCFKGPLAVGISFTTFDSLKQFFENFYGLR